MNFLKMKCPKFLRSDSPYPRLILRLEKMVCVDAKRWRHSGTPTINHD